MEVGSFTCLIFDASEKVHFAFDVIFHTFSHVACGLANRLNEREYLVQ